MKLVRVFLGIVAALVAATALTAAAAPATTAAPKIPGQKQALDAIRRALAAGRIDGADANGYRAEVARAAGLIRGLPPSRARPVEIALEQVGAFDKRLSGPRAVALFGQLKANDDYFAKHYPPADGSDFADDDGVVYRYFAGSCLEFHPLANFGALNADVAKGDATATQALADALIAREVGQKGGGVGWEYYFGFSGGVPPWTSGMAQAVAAQAFERAATLVPAEATAYQRAAHAAFVALQKRLLTRVAAGPWIRLYSFASTAVLNAQLQTVISLQSYATAAGDAQATALASSLEQSVLTSLPLFDTGFWTYYALPNDVSDLHYQSFVVQLLHKLAPLDPRFATAAARIAAYQHQPPAFQLANAGVGQVRFWLSKPSSVTVASAAGRTQRYALGSGWHTVAWSPKRPGIYAVNIAATDLAGNHASVAALPLVRVTSAVPPPKKSKPKTKARLAPLAAKTAPAPPATFVVGAGLDQPEQGSLGQSLGMRAVKLGIAWPAGASTPDPGLVAALQRVPAGEQIVAGLIASPLPSDDPGRAALAAYAASLVQQVPSITTVLLTPAIDATAVPTYAPALATVQTAVHGVAPTVQVGAEIDGSTSPKATVSALAFALSGAPPDVVALQPATLPATGAWTAANVPQLETALTKGFSTSLPVLLDGLTAATPADYASALAAESCVPGLDGVLFGPIADNPDTPTLTTGLYDTTGAAKPGLTAVATAIANVQRGLVVCPGQQVPVATTALTYPTALASGAPAQVQLGCVRDCLYLITLDDATGRPVVAARGALQGGAAPATISLPAAKLASGAAYKVDVRIVNQVNPGPVLRQVSQPIAAG